MNRIKPFEGYCLIRLLPPDAESAGGIAIPQRSLSAEEVQERSHHPTPPPPERGIVEAIGPWPKLSNGLTLMPEFGIGARVVIPHHAGPELARSRERLRLVRNEDVLAVLT